MSAVPARASIWMWLSIAAALTTMAAKSAAAYVSGSVGLLSDAMESGVNLAAAVVTMIALRWSEQPADVEHPFGHARGELLAALFEGLLVFVAGIAIAATAIMRFLHPVPLESISLGLALSVLAAIINGAVGITYLRVGRAKRSRALEADGHHLLSDVWSSVAVFIGVVLVKVTGRAWLDPLAAVIVSGLVLWTGFRILRSSMIGLVDKRLEDEDLRQVEGALLPFRSRGADFTTPRTRTAGRHRFVHLKVLVPGEWSVEKGHALADEVEKAIESAVEEVTVDTHVEPIGHS